MLNFPQRALGVLCARFFSTTWWVQTTSQHLETPPRQAPELCYMAGAASDH